MSATQLRAPALRRVERTKMTPHVDTLAVSIGESSLGQVLVAQSASGVVAVLLGEDRDALRGELATRFPGAEFVDPDAQAATVAARLVKIVDGPGNAADIARIPLDPRGTAFQNTVWRALCTIPAGATATYSEIAKLIGQPSAVRAVAHACATNPIAVLVPCHRVVRTDGSLAGYRWGVDRKRALLEREAAARASSTSRSRAF